MDTLTVRAYNVRFGDAIFITIPDLAADGTVVTRHVLIDVGNVLSDDGGVDDMFEAVVTAIKQELKGKPLDLYVMTHEHLDHTQGLFYAAKRRNVELDVANAWITASAEPDYYTAHPDAKKKLDMAQSAYIETQRLAAAGDSEVTPYLQALLDNNGPFMLNTSSTAESVDYLRNIAGAANTTFVHRQTNLAGRHPFTEAKFTILAPEEDTSEYYGRFQPLSLDAPNAGSGLGADAPATSVAAAAQRTDVLPPAGVDAGAFYNLIRIRQRGATENLLQIDQAANNTSVVLQIEWRGWKLLFPGDAEQRSWRQMDKNGDLGPVDFLKVGHHGSENGTPPLAILDKILPMPTPRQRYALVSTYLETYNQVPDGDTLDELARRCEVHTTLSVKDAEFEEIRITA